MSQKERLLGRLGKIGSQVFISATSLRQEMEALSVEKLEQLARRLNLVRRGEFEIVQAMVKEMRQVQEELRSRLVVLERAQGINSSLRNKSLKKKTLTKSANKRRAK
jgi:BMFP domain-containing protein YqiC